MPHSMVEIEDLKQKCEKGCNEKDQNKNGINDTAPQWNLNIHCSEKPFEKAIVSESEFFLAAPSPIFRDEYSAYHSLAYQR